MKIVCFLKGIRGEVCLTEMLAGGYEITAVVTSSQEGGLKLLCDKNSLPLYYPDNPNNSEFAHQLRSIGADLFVLIGYNKILKPLIFKIPPLGTINLHGGRLPYYRGAAPINWQIINGENFGGCSILFVEEGIDTGPIIQQKLYEIDEVDTHQAILEKTLKIFPSMLLEVLEDFKNGSVQAVPQNLKEGCYFRRRYPEDSKIDWQAMSDIQVHNLVRGMQGPYPHAFTFKGSTKVEIERTVLLGQEIKGISGRILLKIGDGVVTICQNRGILIKEIKIDGKIIEPQEFLRIGEMVG